MSRLLLLVWVFFCLSVAYLAVMLALLLAVIF